MGCFGNVRKTIDAEQLQKQIAMHEKTVENSLKEVKRYTDMAREANLKIMELKKILCE